MKLFYAAEMVPRSSAFPHCALPNEYVLVTSSGWQKEEPQFCRVDFLFTGSLRFKVILLSPAFLFLFVIQYDNIYSSKSAGKVCISE